MYLICRLSSFFYLTADKCLRKKCPFYGVCRLSHGRAQCTCWSRKCVRDYRVCGTNNVTYLSVCHLKRTSCTTKRAIRVAYRGNCLSDERLCKPAKCRETCEVKNGKPHCICKNTCRKSDKDYVCGDNGKTYFSSCVLKLRACQLNQKIKVAHKGRCLQGKQNERRQ